MSLMLTILEWKLNMVETALKDEHSTLVKIGLMGSVEPYLRQCVKLGLIPDAVREIIMSNWQERVQGRWELTCHSVTILEARQQFAAPPPRMKRARMNKTIRIDMLTS